MFRDVIGRRGGVAMAATAFVLGAWAHGAARSAEVDAKLYEKSVAAAIQYLGGKGQTPDGAFSPQAGPAVTALVTTAILRNGRTADDPLVAKSLKYLETFRQPDGGFYSPKSNYKNSKHACR